MCLFTLPNRTLLIQCHKSHTFDEGEDDQLLIHYAYSDADGNIVFSRISYPIHNPIKSTVSSDGELAIADEIENKDVLKNSEKVIGDLLFKLLLVISTNLELFADIEMPSHLVRPEKRHKDGTIKTEALFSPLFIGRRYSQKVKQTNSTGEGGMKSPHWRRGHLRNQAHGKDRALYKVIWIEPVWIDAADSK